MTDADPRSDAELLAATPGDSDAFAVFYRCHVRGVLDFITQRAPHEEIGDLVGEVFATALVYRRRYDPRRGSARAWLIGIARNKLADAARRGAVEARICRRLGMRLPPIDMVEPDPDESDEMLCILPLDQRRAVEGRVLQDKSYRQMACEESVSEQVVRKRVSRALSALRSHFQEEPQ